MHRSVWLAVMTMILALPAPSVVQAAGWEVSGFAGVAFPTGDFADDVQTGPRFGGAVDYLFNSMWHFGVDGSLNLNEHKDVGETVSDGFGGTYTLDEDKFTTWQFGAHAKYMIPVGDVKIHPYALVGAGASGTKEKFSETFTFGGTSTTDSGEIKSDAAFAGRFGAGATWMANSQWGLGGEVDYTTVSADGATLSWVGIHGVITFAIPSP